MLYCAEGRRHENKETGFIDLVRNSLLIPGWAGELKSVELAFVKQALFNDRRLRAKWGFKRGTGRLSEEKIKQVALYGVEDNQNASFEPLRGSVQLRLSDEKASGEGKMHMKVLNHFKKQRRKQAFITSGMSDG